MNTEDYGFRAEYSCLYPCEAVSIRGSNLF